MTFHLLQVKWHTAYDIRSKEEAAGEDEELEEKHIYHYDNKFYNLV